MLNQYVWQSPARLFEHQPTVRVDYNLTARHRLTGSTALIWAERDPDYLNGVDARFPGAPNYRLFRSTRPLTTFALRSTVKRKMVNEVRAGITAAGGASFFGDPRSNGPQSFADQGGFALDFPDFDATNVLTNWFATNNPSWRSAPTYSVDESLTWQKGATASALARRSSGRPRGKTRKTRRPASTSASARRRILPQACSRPRIFPMRPRDNWPTREIFTPCSRAACRR